jgi:general secretion pathway protein E
MVLHVRDREAPPARLADLGLMEEEEAVLRGLLSRSSGLIVVTSPPKAGAGRLVRAMLTELEGRGRSLWAVDRPAGPDCVAASVLEVAPDAPGGYAAAVRAAGEQDPDVILIGSLLDPATAQAAMEAALEGRLVLARMSCASPTEAAMLLLDMGLDPWPLTAALVAVTAAASVRGIAPAGPGFASRADGAAAGERPSEARYEGRLTLTSTLVVDRRVAQALRTGPEAAAALQRFTHNGGVRTLWDQGLASVQAGRTTLEELRRAGLDA